MAENVYENFHRAQREGLTLKEPVLSPPSKRNTSIITVLVILVLLLAVLLTAVTVLFFQKERKLPELEGLAQKYNISLQLCNASYVSLEKSKIFQKERKVQELEELAQKYRNTLQLCNASYVSLEKSKRNLLKLVSAGWKFYNGSFYLFSQKTKTWQEAEEACLSHGVHLTSVTSREEMEFFVRESSGQSFWIGLTDRREEGNWTWTDGTTYSLQVSFWDQGQPDNWKEAQEKREDCVHFRNSKLLSWNDLSCGAQLKWICKKVFSGAEESNNCLAG